MFQRSNQSMAYKVILSGNKSLQVMLMVCLKSNTWGKVEKMTKDRQKCRTFVAALHANGISGSK